MSGGFLLGVDGGGTKTTFCLADLAGQPLAQVTVGSTSFKSVGQAAAEKHLRQGLEQLAAKGFGPQEILCGVWGLSGCDTAQDKAVFQQMLANAGLSLQRHRVINDALLAFYAAATPPGLVCICGTGSIVVGLQRDGRALRRGGWGYPFSDLGSGYWLGAALLREAALWLEGCRPFDPVFAALCSMTGCEGNALLNRLAALENGDEIAAFARLAAEAEASPLCDTLLRQGAGYLAGYIKSLYPTLAATGEEPLPIVLAGGLLRNAKYRSLLAEALNLPAARLVPCTTAPVEGGVKLAQLIWKGRIDL